MSELDFRFEDKPKPAVKKAQKKEVKTKESKAAQLDDFDSSGFEINITIIALIAISALLIGLICGIFVGKSLTPPQIIQVAPATSTSGGMGGMGQGGTSGTGANSGTPALTDDQVQQGMPSGHPTVDGSTGTGTSDTTPKK